MSNIKSKWYILGGIFLCLAIVCIAVYLIKPVEAEETSFATFPVDEAGIAAYVKLDSVDNINIYTDLAESFDVIEKQGESYVIGTVPVTNNPHLYIGLDGWMVAYFLNTEEASRIAGGSSVTTLQDAIDYMFGKIGVTYPTPIKYYDFEFPEANKLTLITEETPPDPNGFYVTVPGTLYEASWWIHVKNGALWGGWLILKVDEITVFERDVYQPTSAQPPFFYGSFDLSTYFKTGITHYVDLIYPHFSSCATVLIYKN